MGILAHFLIGKEERMSLMDDYTQIDEAIKRYLQESNHHWLLNQTLVNADMRRDILASLPIDQHTKLLDVGTGFGAVSYDLASQIPLEIQAIDVDEDRIAVAKDMKEYLDRQLTLPGDISFANEDLYQLPYDDQSFDFVIAWFVFQHLEEIEAATEELARVMRPGGHICIVDIDDQFLLTYPKPSTSAQIMHQALCTLQTKQGGDRFVGRKLPNYLHDAGFDVVGTAIQSQTAFSGQAVQQKQDRYLEINLYQQLKPDIINNNILTEEEFDTHIENILFDDQFASFKANAQVIVLGQKPE